MKLLLGPHPISLRQQLQEVFSIQRLDEMTSSAGHINTQRKWTKSCHIEPQKTNFDIDLINRKNNPSMLKK